MSTWILVTVILGILALPFIPTGRRSRSTEADEYAMQLWKKLQTHGFVYFLVVKKGCFFFIILFGTAVAEAYRTTGSYLPNPGALRRYGIMVAVLSLLSAVADWTAHKNRAAEAMERTKGRTAPSSE